MSKKKSEEPTVKSILISQPEPLVGKSTYDDLIEKYKVTISYRNFISIEPVPGKDFRKNKIDILKHTAILFNSRTAIEHLFRLCAELRVELPVEMKYICSSETVALYLQRFITYRKRKVFYPKDKEKDIFDLIHKHKAEKFLYPFSMQQSNEVIDYLAAQKLDYNTAEIYRTISSDLSDLSDVNFDIIAFFSPYAVKSLYDNYPDFKQNQTRLAGFGANTCQAIVEAGLTLNIEAPTPEAPSMKMALEQYIQRVN